MQRYKKEVIDLLKLRLGTCQSKTKTSSNCIIKSVGQNRSVKTRALIKEKVQKRPILGNKCPQKPDELKLISLSSDKKTTNDQKTSDNKSTLSPPNHNHHKIQKNIIDKNSKIINNSRKRKSPYQVNILRHQFHIQSNWTKPILEKISHLTGLSISQVYKWGWDQGKKQGIQRIPDENLHKLYSEQSEDDKIQDDDDENDVKDEDKNQAEGEEQAIEDQENSKRLTRRQSSRIQPPKRVKRRKNYKLPTTDEFGGYAKRHYSNEILQFDCQFEDKLFHQLAKKDVVLSPNGQMGELRTRIISHNHYSNKSDKEDDDEEDDDENDITNERVNHLKKSLKYSKTNNNILSTSRTQPGFLKQKLQQATRKTPNRNKTKKSPSTSKKSKKITIKRSQTLANSQKKCKRQNKKKGILLKIEENDSGLQASLSSSSNKQKSISRSQKKQKQQKSLPNSPQHEPSYYYPSNQPVNIPFCLQHCPCYMQNDNQIFNNHHHHHHHHYPLQHFNPIQVNPHMIASSSLPRNNRQSSDDNNEQNINEQSFSNHNIFEQQQNSSDHYTPRSHHNSYNQYHQDINSIAQSPAFQQGESYNAAGAGAGADANSYLYTLSQEDFLTPHHFNNRRADYEEPAYIIELQQQQQQRKTQLKQISDQRRVSDITNIANSVPHSLSRGFDPIHSPPHNRQMSAPHDYYNRFQSSSIFGGRSQEQDDNYKIYQKWNDGGFADNHFNHHHHNHHRVDNQDDGRHFMNSSPDLPDIKQRERGGNNKIISFSGNKSDIKVNGFLQNDEYDNDDDDDVIKCQKQLLLDYGDLKEGDDDEEQKKIIGADV